MGFSGDALPVFSPSMMNAVLREVTGQGAGGTMRLAGMGPPLETYCDLVLELQCYAGHEVAYSRVDTCEEDRECFVFIEYEDHATALYAADLALDILNAVLDNPNELATGTVSELRLELDEYVSYAMGRRLDPNARLIKAAAGQRDIPVMNMDPVWGAPTWPGAAESTGVIQYGWGINQQHCRGAFPMGSLSPRQIEQCSDRAQLLPILKSANLPCADQDLEFVNRNQVRRAQRSARRIGYPVTIRPRSTTLPRYGLLDNASFGPLDNDAQVAQVTSYLREGARADVWVESFVAGGHYRFLIMDSKVVSVLRFVPPAVVGDGVQTIADLAKARAEAAEDAETRRVWHLLAGGDDTLSCRLRLREMTLSSVPASGEVVTLRGEGTYYNGGEGVEVLEEVPAHFNTVALQAAAACGFQQMAGIDLVIGDLQRGVVSPNCTVTSVDPAPDLVSHSKLSEVNKQGIASKFLSLIFPPGQSPRIPVVSITGTNGKTTTTRMTAGILKASGLKVGLSCSDGIYLDDEVTLQGDEAGVLGANEVLCSREMEVAVLETARGSMANTGVAFDWVDVGACLNVAEDHLGSEGIETLDQMAVHKRQVIERSSRAVVLNAEDSRCLAMREHASVKEVILFAYKPDHPAVMAHLEAGGCAVVVGAVDNTPTVVLKTTPDVTLPVIAVADIPATGGGAVLHNVYNALAAVGIARALGISLEYIADGLKKFVMGVNTTPGRLNEIPGFPFDVLVDAAHNPHGIRSLLQYLNQREVAGKRVLVFGTRKTLADETIQRCSALLAGNFNLYILRNYRPGDTNDSTDTHVLDVIKKELLKQGVSESAIIVEPGVLDAVDRGIEHSDKGDLLVVQVPAGGKDKWAMIDRIKGSEHHATADLLNSRTVELADSGSDDTDIKLLLCGDVMLGRGIDQILPNPCNPRLHEHWRKIYDAREFIRLAQQKHGPVDDERDMAYVWGNVLSGIEHFAPDLRIINLETAITTSEGAWPEKLIHFRMNPRNIDVLKLAGIDFCALANNHVMDWSRDGLEETIRTLDQAGIGHAGAGSDKRDAQEPAILDVPGKGRVIIVSMGTASSGIPGDWAADDGKAGINLVELGEDWVEDVCNRLAAIKQADDVMLVSIHWGGNYEGVIPQNQREFARQLIDNAGVDIVHGHSSHHVRGIELHRGKLILYGCGDLVNDYEGVEKTPGRQALAPHLGLMYFARVSPQNGRLTGLQMTPVTMNRLRVTRGDEDDARHLMHVLNRECVELGTCVVNENDTLILKAMSS